MAIIAAILITKIALGAPVRLQLYVVEVAIIFVLGFVVLEGKRTRGLVSGATRADIGLALAGIVGLLLWNLGFVDVPGIRISFEPGFADAIALILIFFVGLYGLKKMPPMLAPLSLLLFLGLITVFISNEERTFYDYVGRHFVSLTVSMSAGLLSFGGLEVTTGPDFFSVPGTPTLTIIIGIRCGGLDVAVLYSLLIAYFALRSSLTRGAQVAVAVLAAVGALAINGLRVAILTMLFMAYPPDLIEAAHTQVGDFMFLGYATVVIVGLGYLQKRTTSTEA